MNTGEVKPNWYESSEREWLGNRIWSSSAQQCPAGKEGKATEKLDWKVAFGSHLIIEADICLAQVGWIEKKSSNVYCLEKVIQHASCPPNSAGAASLQPEELWALQFIHGHHSSLMDFQLLLDAGGAPKSFPEVIAMQLQKPVAISAPWTHEAVFYWVRILVHQGQYYLFKPAAAFWDFS